MNAIGDREPRGQLRLDEPMAKHTSWRLGGPADRFYVPADLDDLANFLAALDPEMPVTFIGLGSNLLVRDGGIRGQVIAPLNALREIHHDDAGRLDAQCGVSCARLAKQCQKAGFAGGDFFAGIPGTVGGALAMNAGAFGGETWRQVESVTMIDRRGRIIERAAAEFDVGYRRVVIPAGEWFVAVRFRFDKRGAGEASNIRELLRARNASQPIGQASCGSVFKNPPGKHAAQLIEAAGLKGYCRGEACVSEKHANFIINRGGASAADMEALIGHVRDVVSERFGLRLETEVRIIGEAS